MVYEILTAWLPLLLLLGVWGAIGWLTGLRLTRQKSNIVVDESRPLSSLTLVRAIQATDNLRKYKVYIDKNPVYELSPGETWHFKLEPGVHTLYLKIDWCKSKVVTLEITDHSNIEVNCGASYDNWTCMFMWMFKPSNWIYLRVT